VELDNSLVWLRAGETKNEAPRIIYLDEELQRGLKGTKRGQEKGL
jgi:hypothetical protein